MTYERQGSGFDPGARGHELAGRDAPRVFVVQQPAKLDNNHQWKPIFDISPAKAFGRLVFITLRPGNIHLEALDNVLDHMRSVLKDFNDKDFILPTGEPIAIAAAAAIAARINHGRLKLLKWDRHARRYQIVQFNLKG